MTSLDRKRKQRLIQRFGERVYRFLILVHPAGEPISIAAAAKLCGVSTNTGYKYMRKIDSVYPDFFNNFRYRRKQISKAIRQDKTIKRGEYSLYDGKVRGQATYNGGMDNFIKEKF